MMDSFKFVFIGLACFIFFPCLLSAQTVSVTTEDHTVSSLSVRIEGTSSNIRKTGENKIDISGLKKGVYFIVLNYNNQKITRKFIKQ